MDWWTFITNMVTRVPVERFLFPPRDTAKELEKFAASVQAPVANKEAAQQEKIAISPQTSAGVAQGGSSELGVPQPASDFCPACGPEKHIPIARKALAEAGERFSDGKLTPNGITRVRDAVMELRTYTDTDLKYIEAQGVERDFWLDVKDCIIEIAHELGTSGKAFTIGHGSKEQLEEITKNLEKVEGIAYEGIIRFGRKEVKHAG